MNSFIPWIGGKKLLRNAIIECFPPDGFDRYIEVFGGAGWVLFAKDRHAKLEVFNDVESNLVNLYRCIKHHCAELQRELDYFLNAREVFFDALHQLDTSGLTDIQRAARYYTIIRISFGADRRTYGGIDRDVPKMIERLPEIQERLKHVVVENKDFESLIRVYDRPTALFYLDPPYHGTERHYAHGFGLADHQRLRDLLGRLKGRFVLSYNDDDFVRGLYDGFAIKAVERTNNLANTQGSSGRFGEVIIKNF